MRDPGPPHRIPTRGNRSSGRWRNLTPREYLIRFWHDLRWQLASSKHLSEWIARRLDVGDWYWLFILGLNNSGTTVLKRYFENHSRIRSLPIEGQRLTDALPHPAKLGVRLDFANYPALFHWTEESDPRPAYRAMYDWARLYPPGPGILLEKSPPDSVRSRWLQQHFRPSRFLAIVRSPYAVCEGIRRRTGCPLEEAARHWRKGNDLLFRDMERLDRCLWFRYEDFCADPSGHLEKFETFLDLDEPFDRRGLEEVTSHSYEGFTTGVRNLNPESIERLEPEEIEAIERIAAPLMERLGYEPL